MRLRERVQERFPSHILATHDYRGQGTVVLKREGLLDVARFLRDDPAAACDFLMDLTAVDYLRFGRSLGSAPRMATPAPLPYYMEPAREAEAWARGVPHEAYRFDVVYHLYASSTNQRLRLKVPLTSADPVVDSLTPLWHAANWFEREVWDMFGIRFTGHPNLKRLLMYEEFQGHPLRKDYPVRKRQPLIGPVN
jgi:NADH-quinone oxidoreductase subunit C